MNFKQLEQTEKEYVMQTYNRFPYAFVRGRGATLYDADGGAWVDFGSGIGVNVLGYGDPDWVEAVSKQAASLAHVSNLYYTQPMVQLAEALSKASDGVLKRTFFANSGAEANECAIKVARKYAAEKKGSDYYNIITLKNSFHGRTVTTLAATGQDVFHKDFLPLTEGFIYCEANNCEELRSLVETNKVAAIMFETVQGEGGVLPLESEFVATIFELAESYDILTIADEVQTGNGRTGSLYGFMNYGVTPDIFSTAKGLGGGLPIGATALGEKVENVLKAGDHGSTFGGNPAVCAGAISILNRIDDDLLAEVRKKSEFIINSLKEAKGVKSVSGKGFMLGIETEKDASEVIAECRKNGVLVIKAKTKVRLLPALNIPWDLLEKAVNVIIDACK